MRDPFAVRVEPLWNQRVERPATAGAMTIDDDDLAGSRSLRATHGRVDLLGIELAALFVHRFAALDLIPDDDPADSLHVTHDQDAHRPNPSSRGYRLQASGGRLQLAACRLQPVACSLRH